MAGQESVSQQHGVLKGRFGLCQLPFDFIITQNPGRSLTFSLPHCRSCNRFLMPCVIWRYVTIHWEARGAAVAHWQARTFRHVFDYHSLLSVKRKEKKNRAIKKETPRGLQLLAQKILQAKISTLLTKRPKKSLKAAPKWKLVRIRLISPYQNYWVFIC